MSVLAQSDSIVVTWSFDDIRALVNEEPEVRNELRKAFAQGAIKKALSMAEQSESDSDHESLAGPLRRRSKYVLASDHDVSLYTRALKLATGNGKSMTISAEDKVSRHSEVNI